MAYIDDTNLMEEIRSLKISVGGKNIFPNEAKESVLRVIIEQPTADVVEVVRCKDCKFCTKIEWKDAAPTYCCDFCMSQVIPDGSVGESLYSVGEFFCVLGERK